MAAPPDRPFAGPRRGPPVPLAAMLGRDKREGRIKWSEEELLWLQQGVRTHGEGKWRNIHQDPALGFAREKRRSQVDLKDKWRNINKAKK